MSKPLTQQSFTHVGTHCILELYDCSGERLNDRVSIASALREAASIANSTLIGEINHHFTPHGVTALALLAESHIAIHTWPENRYAAVDIFTCGEHTKPEEACQYLAQVLQAGNYVFLKLPRQRMMTQIDEKIMADS